MRIICIIALVLTFMTGCTSMKAMKPIVGKNGVTVTPTVSHQQSLKGGAHVLLVEESLPALSEAEIARLEQENKTSFTPEERALLKKEVLVSQTVTTSVDTGTGPALVGSILPAVAIPVAALLVRPARTTAQNGDVIGPPITIKGSNATAAATSN